MAKEPIVETKSSATTTSESINNLLIVPFVTRILYAAREGKTPRIACRHQDNRDLVCYILMFHLLARPRFPENNSVHGALKSIYGIQSAEKEMFPEPMEALLQLSCLFRMYGQHSLSMPVMNRLSIKKGSIGASGSCVWTDIQSHGRWDKRCQGIGHNVLSG